MVYLKIENKLWTINDLSTKYDVPRNLIASRYRRGIRKLEELIQPKYEMLRK